MDTYEKKYKEALSRVREALNDGTISSNTIAYLQDIFPELAESEDERIKIELIDYINHLTASPNNIEKYNTWIAWLEKQGEHKRFDYENANIQQKDFASQKDIPRYNIGDVLCDKSCTTLNKELQSNFKITDIRNGLYICDKCSFPISQQDEYELVAKRIESAWSEEDEKIALSIEQVINCASLLNIVPEKVDKIRTWLKSLKERL